MKELVTLTLITQPSYFLPYSLHNEYLNSIITTLTAVSNNDATTLRTSEMSPLLRLPAELRNEIYVYVFTDEYMFASVTYSSMATDPAYGPAPHTCINNPHRVALSSTCRALHAETQNLPFMFNRFSFKSVLSFQTVALRLSPTQRALITHVSITDEMSSSIFYNLVEMRGRGYSNLVDLLPNAHTVAVRASKDRSAALKVLDWEMRLMDRHTSEDFLRFWVYERICEWPGGA
ncbi:hypothetical protein HBH56_167630 [Parastagonospora nodorum]|uniref:Uncharacterized protein n=1 Tax=Phaeosphaeria nodorum (strain SN15 / ATCC MYA-4574 / FGSC 10173) TaxID=321614 RepID=A0A7U2I3N1_PHANO|nr:hypothetical protein HBH56_167630 [Parastagonospora nodorum]QRC98641.1 hypothetical protein JI435_046870 [Parastagonospora nodorum SN15]KAH3936235.1 hypothetical protein HBH54_030720 [Parastagonospora nodorum]KAH4076900.1 hypothetical protein HBH50_012010 [Parastagonospora nodorum]KAH4095621.1 hypothetical protein HBH48_045790 [Parastagonospora nodorum]